MKTLYRLRWLFALSAVAVMAIIFLFSAQPGSASKALSGQAAQQLQNSGAAALAPGWFNTENANANLRKWAHVYLYAALGMAVGLATLAFGACRTVSKTVWRIGRGAAIAAGICVCYAALDELHQAFVPDRTAAAGDVLVDAMGFLPGIILAALLAWLLCRKTPNSK